MNVNVNRVKIVVTIPIENLEKVRNAICEAGAGVIGNYTYCSMSTKCIGIFKIMLLQALKFPNYHYKFG